jgi:YfiH family protein
MTSPLFFTSPLLQQSGLPHLFSTRHFPGMAGRREGGPPFSPEGLATLAARGLDGPGPAFARQVHGADVLRVAAPGPAGTGDALLTDRPGLPLAVFTADCVPIVIHDPVGGRLAAIHAGWRGTAQAVAGAAARALIDAGGDPRRFVAALGPSIGPCCYEVDGPVIERLEAAFPGRWPAWTTARGPARWLLDLWRANADQLVDAGLRAEAIDRLDLCTFCRGDLFYSYRRGAGSGRLATVAALPGH